MTQTPPQRVRPRRLAAVVALSALAFVAAACARESTSHAKKSGSAAAAAKARAARTFARFAPGKPYKKPADTAIKKTLTPLQYYVTQKNGTERPFRNAYWNNKKAGIYVDVVSGEPLFASVHKFKSGTGWPSFYRPLETRNVVKKRDASHFMVRVEVRSKHGDSHLGHVFKDGPRPTGLRYCINSASLRFVPVSRLKAEGYGKYLSLFSKASKPTK